MGKLFWQSYNKIESVSVDEKIIVGRNLDGKTMYADIEQLKNLLQTLMLSLSGTTEPMTGSIEFNSNTSPLGFNWNASSAYLYYNKSANRIEADATGWEIRRDGKTIIRSNPSGDLSLLRGSDSVKMLGIDANGLTLNWGNLIGTIPVDKLPVADIVNAINEGNTKISASKLSDLDILGSLIGNVPYNHISNPQYLSSYIQASWLSGNIPGSKIDFGVRASFIEGNLDNATISGSNIDNIQGIFNQITALSIRDVIIDNHSAGSGILKNINVI
ncbi:MAG: hypothetical protein LBS50_08580 [Prevotellaceae bacterium]|jgi:hypothetical protein|nr:hypothetical protein [Prevotellaceae bacterium]